MRLLLLVVACVLSLGCPRRAADPTPLPDTHVEVNKPPPADRGAPLQFVLEPLERDFEHRPESEVLRGHRAIVLLMASYDVGSLLALRTLAPLFNELPKDALCLQVAVQPIGDRALIGPFMDAEKTPCRRAIGDPKRGRLGDLAKITVLPTVLVLRADGTLAGGHAGTFTVEQVRALLESAKE